MKKRCRILFFSLLIFLPAQAQKRQEQLLNQIETLKQEYLQLQVQLEKATEERWAVREKQVASKQQNKETAEQIRQTMDRHYSDLARAREELLARENTLEREADAARQKQQEWLYVTEALDDKVEKQKKANLEGFPLDQDLRMVRLNALQKQSAGRDEPLRTLERLVEYNVDNLRKSAELGFSRRTFVLAGNEPVTAQVLRVGYCMAYGMDPDGGIYFLGNTGQLGAGAFEWTRVSNAVMAATLAEAIPRWMKTHEVTGTIPVDILQNRYSATLVGAARQGWLGGVAAFVRAGGVVLVPLGLVIIWALVLVVNRLRMYSVMRSRDYRFINEAIGLLGEKNTDRARELASSGDGVLARILDRCLNHSKWSRASAEKSVRELLLTEVPQLDKHLDTLAVLAAAAPLLGLLGTVTGMIEMFEAITRFGTGDPKLLAGGISEALITTEVGLSIAIPLLLIHNFLRNRRNHIQSDMEMYAMCILNRLWPEE